MEEREGDETYQTRTSISYTVKKVYNKESAETLLVGMMEIERAGRVEVSRRRKDGCSERLTSLPFTDVLSLPPSSPNFEKP